MNANALRARMALLGISVKQLCVTTGIGLTAFYRKIAGNSEFTQGEISAISKALELDRNMMCDIFFTDKVA